MILAAPVRLFLDLGVVGIVRPFYHKSQKCQFISCKFFVVRGLQIIKVVRIV